MDVKYDVARKPLSITNLPSLLGLYSVTTKFDDHFI